MFRRFCLAVALVVSASSFAMAEGTALTVPTLGISWGDSISNITTALGGIVVGALTLWAGIKIVQAAKRFIGGAVGGR